MKTIQCFFLNAAMAISGLLVPSLICEAQKQVVGKLQQLSSANQVTVSENLSKYLVFSMDLKDLNAYLKNQGKDKSEVDLKIGQKHHYTLSLEENEMRSPNYRAVLAQENGEIELPLGECNTYKGFANNNPNNIVRLSISNQEIDGYIVIDNSFLLIQPLSKWLSGDESNRLVLFKNSDAKENPGECDFTSSNETFQSLPGPNELVLPNAALQTCNGFEMEIATDADWEFFANHQFNSFFTNNAILTSLNQVEGIYERNFRLTFSVVFQRVWGTGTGDPYT